MKSALIVYSRHTRKYAELISKQYKDVRFLEVRHPPTAQALKIKNNKDIVVGIGGGSVIDTAKLISKNKSCIAIPTTASGAAMTPYATIWGEKKKSVFTKVPILKESHGFPKKLSFKVRQSTAFDALSHAVESLWSKKATKESEKYAKEAISLLCNYLNGNKDIDRLISAGNLAGQAIAITKTNVIHAASYPITIEYGIDHGTACGKLLPYFVEYMDFAGLPELFGCRSTAQLVVFLKKSFVSSKIRNFNRELIAAKIMRYDKINQGPKKINKADLLKILKNIT